MKKIAKGILIFLVSAIVVFILYIILTFPPIMRGMAAKTLCSCVFVSGRSPESVIEKELRVFPGLSDLAFEINTRDSTVTAALLWQKSKAIYRKGLGCTLLAEASEREVRQQRLKVYEKPFPNQDSIPWPMGDLYAFTAAENIDRAAIDSAVSNAFREKDIKNPIHTHAVVVLYNGKIVSEKYAEGFGIHSVFAGWSMTKSITNALIGILVGQGKLHVDEPAPVAEWSNDERKKITLNHLLQASSGLEWSETYFRPDAHFHNMFIRSDDKAGYGMNLRLEHTPGEFFQYSSASTNILSRIIRQSVGNENYHSFPSRELFARTGMYHALIEPDASGTFVASSYGFASARDWARLGLLYLNDGVFNGERILPQGWVQYSTTPGPAASKGEYGAQIWLNRGAVNNSDDVKFPGLPHEAVVFSGFEDNYVVIVPSNSLVVVRLGVTHNDLFDIGGLVTDIIESLPAAGDFANRAPISK